VPGALADEDLPVAHDQSCSNLLHSSGRTTNLHQAGHRQCARELTSEERFKKNDFTAMSLG
jgi:hypothetical protein